MDKHSLMMCVWFRARFQFAPHDKTTTTSSFERQLKINSDGMKYGNDYLKYARGMMWLLLLNRTHYNFSEHAEEFSTLKSIL